MLSFIAKRIMMMIPVLIIVSIISFVIINLPPGDYLTMKIIELQNQGGGSARHAIEQLEKRYGLDRPLYVQYLTWITNFVKGDFGQSFEYDREVRELIGQRFAYTVLISVGTLLFTWLIALPLGIIAATHQYSIIDQFLSFIGFIGMATPPFLLALVCMYVFVTKFGWSVGGLFSPEFVNAPWSWARLIDLLKHLLVPIIVLGMSGTAGLMRIMRGNLLDQLGQQYVTTARSKGLKEQIVIYRHAVRVAINPLITIAGMSLPQIISGETITSVVLNLPTIGPLFLRALIVQDMYLAGSILMLMSVLLLIGNLLADIALVVADPRIRYN